MVDPDFMLTSLSASKLILVALRLKSPPTEILASPLMLISVVSYMLIKAFPLTSKFRVLSTLRLYAPSTDTFRDPLT